MRLYEKRLDGSKQEIRVLRLAPMPVEADVECSLQTISLTNGLWFTALSYVWGDVSKTRLVHANGFSFNATVNLELALRHIRSHTQEKALWVDAVCINQNNVDEKNQQVESQMGALYQTAEKVILWLGPGNEHTAKLVDVVHRGLPSPPDPELSNCSEVYTDYVVELYKISILVHLVSVLPWWTQAWTIQECIIPNIDPVFQCGQVAILWSQFFNVFGDLYQRCGNLNAPGFGEDRPNVQALRREAGPGHADAGGSNSLINLHILGTMRSEFGSGESVSLPGCTAPCIGRRASVARDYIYGFLGLASEEERQQIVVDYTGNYWDAFRDFFELALTTGRAVDLRLMTIIQFDPAIRADHASWIPDLSQQTNPRRSRNYLLQGVFVDMANEVVPIASDSNMNNFRGVMSKLDKTLRSYHAKFPRSDFTSTFPSEALIQASQDFGSRRTFSGTIDTGLLEAEDQQLDFWWNVLMNPGHENFPKIRSAEGQLPRPQLGGLSVLTAIAKNDRAVLYRLQWNESDSK